MGLSAAHDVLGRGRARSRFLRLTGLAGVAIAAAALAAPAFADTPTSVVVIQESNGFPGGEEATRLSRQQVSVRGDRLRVFDPTHAWALYVSLGESRVREASIGTGEYVEREFAHYEKYRLDRLRTLEQQATEFVRLHQRIDDEAERLALRNDYRKIGGDPEDPGHIEARLLPYPNDTKTVTILVDREPREVTVEHFVIRENDKEKAAFDLWVTKDLELPVDLLDFYRQLVPFGPEVTEQLAQVEGTLIECEARVDTGTFHRTFRSKVHEIRLDQALTDADLTIPAGWTQVDDKPKTAAARAGEVVCALDGETISKAKAVGYRDPRTKVRYYVCDAGERKALVKLLAEGKQPPHGQRGGGS